MANATPSQGPQALNDVQSISGLGTTTLFTAPAAGTYFVMGKLELPQIVTSGSASGVVVTVKKNSSTIYTGTAGDMGFEIGQIVLAAADVISVVLTSSAAIDQPVNAVGGEVAFGNTF